MENLIRISDILVSDAITRKEHKAFNIVDVILNRNGKLTSLVISGKGLLGLKHVAKDNEIDEITHKNIIIKSYSNYKRNYMKKMNYSFKGLVNKSLVSENREYLGRLSDFYINIEKMQVVAVEVSRSLFEDLFTGRTIIPGNIIADEENSIIITDLQIENSIHNTKGIINAIDDGIKGE